MDESELVNRLMRTDFRVYGAHLPHGEADPEVTLDGSFSSSELRELADELDDAQREMKEGA